MNDSTSLVVAEALTRNDAIAVIENAVRENYSRLEREIDTRGWRRLGNDYTANGLSLQSIKKISEELRGQITASSIIGRLAELRGSYFYGDGVGFKNLGRAKSAFLNDRNIAKLFSVPALLELNRAHGSDGNVVAIVEANKTITLPPLIEIGDPFVNPDDKSEVWFVRRTYTKTTIQSAFPVEVDMFIPTLDVPAEIRASRAPSVDVGNGKSVRIEWDRTAVLWATNTQTGQPLGTPDLLSALQWSEKYGSFLKNQHRFAEAVAAIAWHFTASNSDAARSIAEATVNGLGGIARNLATTDNTTATRLGGASDVNFDNGRPMAALAAAGAGMLVDELLGEGGTAAAKQIDPQVRRAVEARRREATVFFQRVGKALGAPKLEVIWPNLSDETPFREAQMIIAAWGTGLYDPETIRRELAQRLGVDLEEGSKAPVGVMIPNNAETEKLKSAKTDNQQQSDGDSRDGGTNGQGKDVLGVGKLSDGDNTARDQGETV